MCPYGYDLDGAKTHFTCKYSEPLVCVAAHLVVQIRHFCSIFQLWRVRKRPFVVHYVFQVILSLSSLLRLKFLSRKCLVIRACKCMTLSVIPKGHMIFDTHVIYNDSDDGRSICRISGKGSLSLINLSVVLLLLCHIPHLPVLPSTETQGDADGMLTYADAFRVAICFQAIFERITTLPLPLPFTRSNSPYHFIDVLS